MANRQTLLVTATLLCAIALSACRGSHGANGLKKAVNAADSLVRYQIAASPTLASEQKTGQFYLHDFAIIGKLPLSAIEMADLKKVLLDAATFDTIAIKSCPMVPRIAIDFLDKGKSSMTLILSPSPCGKVLLFDAKPGKKVIYMELIMGNLLEPIVFRGVE